MNKAAGVLAACLAGASPALADDTPTPDPVLTEQQQRDWLRFTDEHRGHQLIVRYSAEFRPRALAITGATVIPMTGEAARADRTVVVEGGRFAAIGGAVGGHTERAAAIDGSGRYLIPGLTDVHTHTIYSLSQFLVYLTRGVTALREMDGFPWMLAARDKARGNELLIPNLYVAGHILSHRGWDFFMTQVDTPEQVRAEVQAQARAGYDFIKIHNSMPEPLFSAVFEAARAAGLDVVGHIPNEIPIAAAIAAGMRTNEHFKGYLYDETLEITDQDYVAATADSSLWNAPSFANYHDHLRGDAALELVTRENSLRLVPRWLRDSWRRQAAQPIDRLTELRQTIYPKSREIFARLRPVTDKFIAGTDTGTYAMMVPGFTLQEELRIFESLGLSPLDALATGTVNAALAMRKNHEYGTIEVGKRADFVLLGSDPLEQGMKALADIVGVSVRGVWLDRAALDRIERSLEEAFTAPVPPPTLPVLEQLVSEIETLKREGFPYPAYLAGEVETFLVALDYTDLARRIAALGS